MTAPDNAPDFYETRTNPPRCAVPDCCHPSALVSLWTGRRCRCHRSLYSPTVVSLLLQDQRPDTAEAYRRTFRQESP